jgi:predicted aminopeptidase
MSRRGFAWLPLLAALLAGCASPAYYLQAVGGQWEIYRASRPLANVVADPAQPADLRQRLGVAAQIRDFASRELGLPDNGSYRKFADLGRPFVVWNVLVAPPLSVEARKSCFPVAGCVSYRGYFAEAAAESFAADRRAEGDDVFVAGVPAYSTLGWFDDPILNTFIRYPEVELARLLFHELAHQIVYVKGDTTFNESFAVAVEEAGAARWIAARGTPSQRETFARGSQRRSDFHGLVKKARERLARVYAGPGSEAERLAKKAEVLTTLQSEYRALRDGPWGGFAGYDRWFGGVINNATLASVGLYLDGVPAFRALQAENGGDLPRFFAAVRALAALPKDQRDTRLADVLAKGPAASSSAPAPPGNR